MIDAEAQIGTPGADGFDFLEGVRPDVYADHLAADAPVPADPVRVAKSAGVDSLHGFEVVTRSGIGCGPGGGRTRFLFAATGEGVVDRVDIEI